MARVFISYSRKDLEFAERLTDELKKSGLEVWIDLKQIPPTVDWWREIEIGIEEADAVLSLVSPDYAVSVNCGREIDHALQNGKRLIPLVVKDVRDDEAPPKLKHLNYIFFSKQDSFDTAFKELTTAIQTDYEWVREHRWLQVRALDWQRQNKDIGRLLRGKDLQDAGLWLATNSSKEPYPTDLQREYVFESQKSTERQRRITTSISVTGVILTSALAIFAFFQAKLATDRANIALARQLASQAQSINTTFNSKQLISTLLDIQSMKIYPTWEAASFLINNNNAALLVRQMTHDNSVYAVAFSPDGKHVVSGSSDGNIYVWDAESGVEVAHMTHDVDRVVYIVAFSPNGKYVVSGSSDRTARVWEAESGAEIARMTHNNNVRTVASSPDGKYVVSGSEDGTARVWEAESGAEIARMTHDNMVTSVAFSPDGKFVLFVDSTTIQVWQVESGAEVARMPHDAYVFGVAFSPDGKYVVSGSEDDTARVWEVESGVEVVRMTHDSSVTSVAFSPDGKYVVSGSWDDTARVWETESQVEVTGMTHDDVSVVAFSNGKFVASGSRDGTIRVQNTESGVEVARMTHYFNVSLLVFSPDGKYLVSVSFSDARVWEAESGAEVARMIHNDRVDTVAFSPDGKYVVSGGWDHTARVWEAESGAEVARMIHDNYVRSVAFSPDGKYVVSGSNDGTTRVWEVSSGNEAARMIHTGRGSAVGDSSYEVSSVAFSPDGKFVVTNSFPTAHVWEWKAEDLIANACAVMPRNLTLEEWNQYIGPEVPYEVTCDPEIFPNAVIPFDAQEYLDSQE